ncbi:MAG: zinc ribbon domain-containing protein [Bacteroidales bacterium]
MGKFDRFCQSCGMPMEKDTNHGGTNKDGSKNSKYCSYCLENGEFKDNFTSSKEMIRFAKGKLKEQSYGCMKRWFYTSHISHLERWKK